MQDDCAPHVGLWQSMRLRPGLPFHRNRVVDDKPRLPHRLCRLFHQLRIQEPGGADREGLLVQEMFRRHPAPGPAPVADSQVDMFAAQVADARGRDQLQADVGMPRFQAAELRDKPRGGKRAGQSHGYAGAVARTRDLLGGLTDRHKSRADLIKVILAGRRQLHRISDALKQRHAQMLFELMHLVADG
jgi:hypothetical protein